MTVALMDNKPRPPFVRFEQRPVEDRNASIAAGHLVQKDVDWVLVHPVGSRDRLEFIVSSWLATTKQQCDNGIYPREWYGAFKQKYEEWKSGIEGAVEGTSLINWPAISRSRAETLIAARIHTVEDLAELNEEGMRLAGIGTRELKQKAQAWLASAKDSGKTAEKVVALEAQVNDLIEQNKRLIARLEKAEAGVEKTTETLSLKGKRAA